MDYVLFDYQIKTTKYCCTVKECDRSRVQQTARLATVTSQLGTVVHPYKAYD